MKIFYTTKLALIGLLISTNLIAQSGPGGGSTPSNSAPEFKTWTLEPNTGSAGSVGATYRFHSVLNNIDALVKINDRSSNRVKLIDIDMESSGYDKALQPIITYNNGSTNSSVSWWMEFQVTFVQKDGITPVTFNSFYTTAVDIDGDNDNLHEVQYYYAPNTWTLESVSNLTVSNFLVSILGLLTPVGKKLDGVTQDYPGIDTTATQLMATMHYVNVSNMKFRVGGETIGGGSDNTERMYSIYYKNFNFIAPITLPVQLTSFTATLANSSKVDLKWITATEIDVNHFAVERSIDGVSFDDAGIVFAYGNTTETKNYTFPDNIAGITVPVIYYRLRSVDNDGKAQYSATRIVRLAKQNSREISIVSFPNPVINEVRISIPNEWQNKKASYEIISMSGQVTVKKEVNSASQTEVLSTSHLSNGMYFVRISCEGQTAMQKIIKQ